MKATEIRRRFLEFFAGKGHEILPSDSLIPPAEDKSLLFTGAGMIQFKSEFLGRGRPGVKRAVTSQKCFRTGDIENVGRTAYHHTFFEMLGNFSFGDYFKRETILWGWQFLTAEMKLPPDRLRVSIYEDDDEAATIWNKEIGLDPKVIYRYGQHENFWPADAPKLGPNGLCGPCSEIYYDWGAAIGCGRPECEPSCSCGRFMEVWNLVFQQFDRQEGGALVPLSSKNIDTGMGLERLARVMQNGRSNFDTDLFIPILRAVEQAVAREYEPLRDKREGIFFRRVADHARASVFCVCDGILPGNTGRGYVLRKIIRRAALAGSRLGKKQPFLYALVPSVVNTLSDQYPEIAERRENVARLIRIEEERFHQTLEQGLAILDGVVRQLRAAGVKQLPGAEAFRLFDTYGLPLDVTESVLEDEGIVADREGYEREMERQRELSRKGTRIAADIFGGGPVSELKEQAGPTQFDGYDKDEVRGTVVGIVVGEELRNEIAAGTDAAIALDRTTFYGESGGEIGDAGLLAGPGVKFEVADTQRSEGVLLHIGKLAEGRLRVGDALSATPDAARRNAIRRAHTATHLLHLSLREVLGKHAEQAGSLVSPDRLRFDFRHTRAMTPEEIRLVEDRANDRVLSNDPVAWRVLPLEQARAEGAMALFGEKYGETVRLMDIGGYSKELCGGLHASATGQVGLIKIIAETSVAAGVRRIEALTGREALRHVREKEEMLRSVASAMGAQEVRVLERAQQLDNQIRELKRELQRARSASRPGAADLLKNARTVAGVPIVAAHLAEGSAEELRAIADQLRQSAPSVAVALGSAAEGNVILVVALTKDLVARGLHAGKIAGQAARLVGGGGGGKPDLAQAGGKDPSGLDKAVEEAGRLIAEKLGAQPSAQ